MNDGEVLSELVGRDVEDVEDVRIRVEISEEPTAIEHHRSGPHSPRMPMTLPWPSS